MSDPAAAPKPARSGRGVRIALALSLALNLLILGLVAGAVLAVGPRGGDDPRLRTLGLGPFALALSREDQEAVRGRIDRDALRTERRALGASLLQLRQALLAEPFDRAAAEAALARSRAAAEALQGQGHAALLDQIGTMDAAERAALADRLERALRRLAGRDR
ncbi:periplasmic heavy metal sensor [Roseicyclus persicicus]|uniref:Periplasmic heavy metal sensor n=1 Tax=Roseicyclus persicicus TaxID=2650661 RepID=A0A7X6GWK5_9RHOB|nr:periplasmic heavy metal sensor [Roseibacterium persicicum]NKX43704.1 periplasmic heavy metal sensor [Roseibacterium persicicum]